MHVPETNVGSQRRGLCVISCPMSSSEWNTFSHARKVHVRLGIHEKWLQAWHVDLHFCFHYEIWVTLEECRCTCVTVWFQDAGNKKISCHGKQLMRQLGEYAKYHNLQTCKCRWRGLGISLCKRTDYQRGVRILQRDNGHVLPRSCCKDEVQNARCSRLLQALRFSFSPVNCGNMKSIHTCFSYKTHLCAHAQLHNWVDSTIRRRKLIFNRL